MLDAHGEAEVNGRPERSGAGVYRNGFLGTMQVFPHQDERTNTKTTPHESHFKRRSGATQPGRRTDQAVGWVSWPVPTPQRAQQTSPVQKAAAKGRHGLRA